MPLSLGGGGGVQNLEGARSVGWGARGGREGV